ncbi:MAG: carboxypeptidase-like regulatory domain-containing protein, partial [Gemmatimonadota bacterium]
MARTRRGWWVWVLLTLGTVGEAAAQQGMVVGRVLGRTGPVPAAEAELRRDTVVVGRAASDGFGVFRFVALEPGRYTVNVEALLGADLQRLSQ